MKRLRKRPILFCLRRNLRGQKCAFESVVVIDLVFGLLLIRNYESQGILIKLKDEYFGKMVNCTKLITLYFCQAIWTDSDLVFSRLSSLSVCPFPLSLSPTKYWHSPWQIEELFPRRNMGNSFLISEKKQKQPLFYRLALGSDSRRKGPLIFLERQRM